MIGLAEESESLLWDRRQAEAKGVDSALICTRRIDALTKLASLVLDLQRLGETDLTTSAGTVKKLKNIWMTEVGAVASELLPADDVNRLLAAYERRISPVDEPEASQGRTT